MTTTFPRRALFLLMTCAGLMILLAIPPASAQTNVTTADGQPITEDEIEQRTRLILLSTHKPSERQDVINALADERRKIKEAERNGVGPTDEDADRAFQQMCSRMHITPEQLTKSLETNGVHPDTLKQRMKGDIARINLAHLGHYKY